MIYLVKQLNITIKQLEEILDSVNIGIRSKDGHRWFFGIKLK